MDRAQAISDAVLVEAIAVLEGSREDPRLRDIISSLADPKTLDDASRSKVQALAKYLMDRRVLIVEEGMDWADIMTMTDVVSVEVAKFMSPDIVEKQSLTAERDQLVGGVAEKVVGRGIELI